MADETSDGITYPTLDDEYALIPDLAAMAESIQLALEKRANARKGTQTERVAATNDSPEGTLWKETTGTGGLYVREGTGWRIIWPTPSSRRLLAGSETQDAGRPFMTMMRVQDGVQYASTVAQENSLPGEGNAKDIIFQNIVDDEVLTQYTFNDNGMIVYRDNRDNSPVRPHPFAYRSGTILVSGYSADETFSRSVSFPSGYFTQTPRFTFVARTGAPHLTHISIANTPEISKDQATVNIHRNGIAEDFIIEWEATQWLR